MGSDLVSLLVDFCLLKDLIKAIEEVLQMAVQNKIQAMEAAALLIDMLYNHHIIIPLMSN